MTTPDRNADLYPPLVLARGRLEDAITRHRPPKLKLKGDLLRQANTIRRAWLYDLPELMEPARELQRIATELFQRNQGILHQQRKLACAQCQNDSRLPDFDEFESAATVALWKAALTYDPSHGIRFVTYAVHVVQREVWRAIEVERRKVRLLVDTEFELYADGRSLEERDPVAWDDYEWVTRCMDGLDKRHRRAFEMRQQGAKLDEIGRTFGVSKERARQMVVKAKAEIRQLCGVA